MINKNIKKKLAKNIRLLRHKIGISQEELSLELDNSYIRKVENQKLNITFDKLILIANYFNIPVKNLFD